MATLSVIAILSPTIAQLPWKANAVERARTGFTIGRRQDEGASPRRRGRALGPGRRASGITPQSHTGATEPERRSTSRTTASAPLREPARQRSRGEPLLDEARREDADQHERRSDCSTMLTKMTANSFSRPGSFETGQRPGLVSALARARRRACRASRAGPCTRRCPRRSTATLKRARVRARKGELVMTPSRSRPSAAPGARRTTPLAVGATARPVQRRVRRRRRELGEAAVGVAPDLVGAELEEPHARRPDPPRCPTARSRASGSRSR